MPPRHASASMNAPLTAPEEIIVTSHRIACDGGGGALGHPLVYLDMGDDGQVRCGYCDRLFRLGRKGKGDYHDPSPRAVGGH